MPFLTLRTLTAFLVSCSLMPATAQVPSPPPDPAVAAPALWRDFLQKAKQADMIADPLRRCLDYPDMPGNRWPARLAASYCEALHGPRITIDQVEKLLASGDLAGLERLFRRDLERHFDEKNFSEVSHRAPHDFDDGQRASKVARAWLAKAPASAFANAFMGAQLIQSAWSARGGAYIDKTPEENLARMHTLADEARVYLERSLKLEPKLIDSQVQLISLARMTSDEALGERAWAGTSALDPGCRDAAIQRMRSLEPRWGGSIAAMAALARELDPLVAKRPLLANVLIQPQFYVGEAAARANKYDEAVNLLRPVAKLTTDPDIHETLGMSMARRGADDLWERIVYLLVGARFSEENFAANYELAVGLERAGEYAWSQRPLRAALRKEPANSTVNYALGLNYFNEQQFAMAIPFLIKGLADKRYRQVNLTVLTKASLAVNQFDNALLYSEQLVADYPKSADAWYLRGTVMHRLERSAEMLNAAEQYLRVVDRSDPNEQTAIAGIEAMLAARRAKP